MTVPASLVGAAVLAATKTPHAPKGGEGVKSGPIGLAVILVLCVVAYFLFKSMSKHLRKVREEFPVHADGQPPASHTAPTVADQPADPPAAEAPPEPGPS